MNSSETEKGAPIRDDSRDERLRIAILTLHFQPVAEPGAELYPAELSEAILSSGFEVRHFYAHYPELLIGMNYEPSDIAVPLEFTRDSWNSNDVQTAFRTAMASFSPDYAVIAGPSGSKPVLASSIFGYPYFIIQSTLECLCPLNSARLLRDSYGCFTQCLSHQFSDPEKCARCLHDRDIQDSPHRTERQWFAAHSPSFYTLLERAYAEAEAVLVLNPFTRPLVWPYARSVSVAPRGLSSERFPWPWKEEPAVLKLDNKTTLLIAADIHNEANGFPIVHRACTRLWRNRKDFRLVAFSESKQKIDDFTCFVRYPTREESPSYFRSADIIVSPTLTQAESGYCVLQAMATGRPVVASRLGILPYLVADGGTGLLAEPRSAHLLAASIQRLLDAPSLAHRLGLGARRRFEKLFTWDSIVESCYRPLFEKRRTPKLTQV